MSAAFSILPDKLLKRTISRCPVCHKECPAEVWRKGAMPARIILKRTCADHGDAEVCIASDARFYWLAQGKREAQHDSMTAAGFNGARLVSTGLACCASDGSADGTLGRIVPYPPLLIRGANLCLFAMSLRPLRAA